MPVLLSTIRPFVGPVALIYEVPIEAFPYTVNVEDAVGLNPGSWPILVFPPLFIRKGAIESVAFQNTNAPLPYALALPATANSHSYMKEKKTP